MEQIKNLIVKGNIGEAIKALSNIIPNDETLMLLLARFNKARKQYMLGVVENSEYNIESNKIVFSLLELVSQLENSSNTTPQNNNHSSSQKRRILFLSASPKGYSELRFAREEGIISNAMRLQENRRYELKHDFSIKVDNLIPIITQFKPNIVHISAHNNKKEGLLFVNDLGEKKTVSTEILSMIFKAINRKETQVSHLILNACNSEKHAEALSAYVPNVIGMRDFIPDEEAIAFTEGFYNAFLSDENIETAVENGKIGMLTAESAYEYESDIPIMDIPVLFTPKYSSDKFLD